MYAKSQIAWNYLRYWFTARNSRGHGMHSPFVFDFITAVLRDRHYYPEYTAVERLRAELLRDNTLLPIQDLGAGSFLTGSGERTVASLARHAAKPRKYARLLFRIARHYPIQTVLELGTSLGISAAYLGAAKPDARIYSIEGAPAVAEKARHNLKRLHSDHVQVIEGNFDEVLPSLLRTCGTVDLAFIDGNHRKEATLRYFDQLLTHCSETSILIFDDIHWSRDMEAAWSAITRDPRVKLTVDLFFMGLVFVNPAFLVKQHFKIRF